MLRPDVAALIVAGALLAASENVARADDPDPAALALFQEGRALADAGNHAEACAKFQASYRLVHKLGTLLNLADCNERTGRTATAWVQFTEAKEIAARTGQDDRVLFAEQHMAALAPTLSRLTVSIASPPPPPGLVVKRDGVVLEPPALGTAVPIDPGPHTIEATAPGKRTWSSTVTMGPDADTRTVRVPDLEDEPATTAKPALSAEAPSARFDASSASRTASRRRTYAIVLGGTGAVGIGASAAFGLMASTRYEESKRSDDCIDDYCNQRGLDTRRSASTLATVSTIAFVSSAVFIAGGVILWLTAPSARAAAPISTVLRSVTVGASW